MLRKDIFIGQKVGYKLKNDPTTYVGEILDFYGEKPDTHVIIGLPDGDIVYKNFNNILGLLN